MSNRIEKDFLGEKMVPDGAYFGIQTIRATENFPVTGTPVSEHLILALAQIKKAAALANMETGMLSQRIGAAIVQAAEEIGEGKLAEQFIVDAIQGGAGTSINMNMNEVLANRALELLGKEKGDYFQCSPNNNVNMSQSTNDTVPTAIRIAAYRLAKQLIGTVELLEEGFYRKAEQFDGIIKMGRTHLQDAVPIRLGQEFGAYARVIGRDKARITAAADGLLTINLGATAVGTGLNANPKYIELAVRYLAEQTGIPLTPADDLVDATQNTDAYTALSSALKIMSVNLSKICNDIRFMASGPRAGISEIHLPPRQPGSSIMPGKVNPVLPEMINQIAFQVMGNDHTICLAAEAGQLELNVMGPVIASNLLQSLLILNNGLTVFLRFAVDGIQANEEGCKAHVENSFGVITALNPHLGYETAARIVKEALHSGQTIKEICLERQLLTVEELEEILNPYEMTTPGIAGFQYLENSDKGAKQDEQH
ncbi:aspartate ammonia-lyase [Paenibacillus baekrokdamisoli]|uniref:aspartate ammonia-lyase n=1 Tax=Paenibacillus baekrokdamisoli TaxID=1712516 RepID=A0A3G9J6W1_9BACL|nr:aspartate ammonia-lyase [Paenibacillus baekrokdamisoli]MBB3069258.1 aspartate ammonia-lyase [Paenibacillus baekrokdamisoli]BBH18769.1 aspartate ammonia-lyase [Paenibacillus baekrokdamisoli]